MHLSLFLKNETAYPERYETEKVSKTKTILNLSFSAFLGQCRN